MLCFIQAAEVHSRINRGVKFIFVSRDKYFRHVQKRLRDARRHAEWVNHETETRLKTWMSELYSDWCYRFLYQRCHHQGKSGKVDILESQGISIFFVGSQGKSRKMIWLRWPKVCPWFLGIFCVKTQWLQVQNFSSLHWGFHAISIKSVMWAEVRESQGKVHRKEILGKCTDFCLKINMSSNYFWITWILH